MSVSIITSGILATGRTESVVAGATASLVSLIASVV